MLNARVLSAGVDVRLSEQLLSSCAVRIAERRSSMRRNETSRSVRLQLMLLWRLLRLTESSARDSTIGHDAAQKMLDVRWRL